MGTIAKVILGLVLVNLSGSWLDASERGLESDVDADGNTVVHRAAMNPDPEAMLAFIKSLDLTQELFLGPKNNKGETPLEVAYWSQPTKIIRFKMYTEGKPRTGFQAIYESLFGENRSDKTTRYYLFDNFLLLGLGKSWLDEFGQALLEIDPEGAWGGF